ncbi:TPA: cation efflux system protein CusF [Salmonella enterica subsp. enterica serovar Birkenhead]|uniref:Cation efflux system protein CusF n=1 Tax=Salmonella sp. 14 TaxID=1179812 RepID=I3W3G2_9ENTR|nr:MULTISPECIES: cation efflux system protein CusF [Salmonella]EAY2125357.1 copper ABC transporter substrate-binding protein [Salmonella enterica]EBV7176696.1 copper ABC transporter substrate-binding protein [Salmonella enterica subsp. enterica serovar Thompson]EDS5478613.1 cation efflux system protein CusF [Salmonella enterica subsp. enterica]EDZ5420506.1 cation efflux system protein CusF [Salmonella enterica subsp. enterica serovar Muenchen]EHC6923155.1 cation efflux system protein CusF [Sal
MHQSMKAVFFGILSLVMAQAAQAGESHQDMQMSHGEMKAEQQVISATGIVKDIDFQNKKITIAHEAIPAIGWPAMTMRFTFTTQDNGINALKSGNKVNFSFVQQGNISLLQDIQVTQS